MARSREMGWWGISSDDTEDRDNFDQIFSDYVKKLKPKDVVTIADCHIGILWLEAGLVEIA